MDYKKLVKSQNLRFFILRLLSFVPDRTMLGWQYRVKLGRKMNWKKPTRFTEFLQRYKADYRNPVIQRCVDKYQVREFIESKDLGNTLVPLLGVYDNASQIPFDRLPEKFVVKTSNGGGGENVVICHDKKSLNIEELKENLDKWLKLKSIDAGREWAYTGITDPKIVVEELLENTENPETGIDDYKILCFNGKPEVVIYDCDRYIGHKRNFYDVNWNDLHITSDCPGKDEKIPKPKNLEKMLEIASRLSEDFPFVRVDLYNIDGRIFFGELTFYPWSGYVQFNPDSFDTKLGSFFDLASFKKK